MHPPSSTSLGCSWATYSQIWSDQVITDSLLQPNLFDLICNIFSAWTNITQSYQLLNTIALFPNTQLGTHGKQNKQQKSPLTELRKDRQIWFPMKKTKKSMPLKKKFRASIWFFNTTNSCYTHCSKSLHISLIGCTFYIQNGVYIIGESNCTKSDQYLQGIMKYTIIIQTKFRTKWMARHFLNVGHQKILGVAPCLPYQE